MMLKKGAIEIDGNLEFRFHNRETTKLMFDKLEKIEAGIWVIVEEETI